MNPRQMALLLAGVCVCVYGTVLAVYGEMFGPGSDVIANTAFGRNVFSSVHVSSWTVPKPAEMLLFGSAYWLTGSLVAVHVVLLAAAATVVFAGCYLAMSRAGILEGVAFFVLMLGFVAAGRAALFGAPGALNCAFLMLAVLCAAGADSKVKRYGLVASLSLANLARPDSWPVTYLIVAVYLGSRRLGEWRSGKFRPGDLLFAIPLLAPLVWLALGSWVFGDPLYASNVAKEFNADHFSGPGAEKWQSRSWLARYRVSLSRSIRDLMALETAFSIRTLVLLGLGILGGSALWARCRYTFALLASLVVGTLFFYLVYAALGTTFRPSYMYAPFVCGVLALSFGIGRAARWVGKQLGSTTWERVTAAACLAFVVFWSPQRERWRDMQDDVAARAKQSFREERAVTALVERLRAEPDPESTWVFCSYHLPVSRVALRLGSGERLRGVERFIRRTQRGLDPDVPPVQGQVIYYCVGEQGRFEVGKWLEASMRRAVEKETFFKRGGIWITRCVF